MAPPKVALFAVKLFPSRIINGWRWRRGHLDGTTLLRRVIIPEDVAGDVDGVDKLSKDWDNARYPLM
jgi:hypothetical protein